MYFNYAKDITKVPLETGFLNTVPHNYNSIEKSSLYKLRYVAFSDRILTASFSLNTTSR